MASTEDALGGGRRCIRRLHATEELAGKHGWEHLRMVLRVESETLDPSGQRIAHENSHFASNLPASRLSAQQRLRVVRLHWAVENDVHYTLEDGLRGGAGRRVRVVLERRERGSGAGPVARRSTAGASGTQSSATTTDPVQTSEIPWRSVVSNS